jgi:hypothetical protein
MESLAAGATAACASTAAARVVSEPGIRALRAALQAELRDRSAGVNLPALVTVVCREAHRSSLPPESLIVALKRAWHSLPEVERLPRSERSALLDRTITLCIRKFYATTDH